MGSTAEFFYPEIKVGGFSRVDGTVEFYQRINSIVRCDDIVLDIGAGRGAAHVDNPHTYRTRLMNFRDKAAKVIGLDVDPAVLENPSVNEAFVFGGDQFPLADASVDVAFADWVLEHIKDPQSFSAELERVLRPNGWFCARTPNKWGYISLASRIVPEKLHSWVLRRAQPQRQAKDVFPTFYRLNSITGLRRAFPAKKWNIIVYTHNSEPAYFGENRLLWSIANFMFRLTPSNMGSVLMLFVQKKQ